MATTKNLGRLQRVPLREAWSSESSDFTLWLAQPENLVLLAESIGIELELDTREKDVGPFRADILCKDTADNWVLIENQLERTDHSHLGQLLTYAAGLNAVTIVWVAERLTEEHRAALTWLNEHTDEKINLCLLIIRFFLKTLTLPASAGRVFVDAIRHRLVALDTERVAPRSSCSAAGDPGVAAWC